MNQFANTKVQAWMVRSRWARFLVFALFIALTPAGEPNAADDAKFETTLPPSFDAAKAQGFGSIFTSCTGTTVTNAVAFFADAIKNKGEITAVSINTPCPEEGSVSALENLTCDAIRDVDGKIIQSKIDGLKKLGDAALGALSCRKNKMEAIKGELGCLTQQANAMAQQITSLQGMYVQNIQKMQQDVGQIEAAVKDREAQSQDVLKKLNGDEATGERGLKALKEQTEQMVREMNDEILGGNSQGAQAVGIGARIKAAEDQRKALKEQIETKTMALTGECFRSKAESSYRCERNGPPVSAYEYVLCRYKQNQFLGKKGVVERNKGTQLKAEANAQALQNILDSILASSPKGTKAPKTAEDVFEQPLGVLSMADVEQQYGGQLARFNGNGLNIHDFTLKVMGSCLKSSERTVSRERKRVNTILGQNEANIQKMELDTANETRKLLQKYSQQYTENIRGLTEVNLPVNTSACTNAAARVQLQCLGDLKNNMQALLDGTAKESATNITIRASDSGRNIPITCYGINGCITKLQNISNNLQKEKQALTTRKDQYVRQGNQGVEAFTKQMALTLGKQNEVLSNQLKALNAALASLGVSQGIDIPAVESETLEIDDKTGLYNVPKNLLNLIGSQMSPPMLNVAGNSFSSALSGMADETKKIGEDAAKAQHARVEVDVLKAKCESDNKKKLEEESEKHKTKVEVLVQQVRSSIEGLKGKNCEYSRNFCQDERSSLFTLTRDIDRMIEGSGLDSSIALNLKTGIDRLCPGGEVKTLEKALQGVKDEEKKERETKFLGEQKEASEFCEGIADMVRQKYGLIKTEAEKYKSKSGRAE